MEQENTQEQISLAYWPIRGLAQPIRFFLEYAGLKFNDIRYTDRAAWHIDKQTLKTDFPNLPYLLDGERVVTESDAIYHYVAFKAKRPELAVPSNEDDMVLLAQIRYFHLDLRRDLTRLAFSHEMEKLYDESIENIIKPRLNRLSQNLGSKPWFVNSKLTYIDFMIQETLKMIDVHDENVLDENLKNYVKRFYDLPEIKAYMSSERWVDAHFLAPEMTQYTHKKKE
jgi:glutathione S-transferase